MNSTERTQEALLARTEQLCNSIIDIRSSDPRGGNGYLSTILRAVRMEETSAYAEDGRTNLGGAWDYASSAHRELVIGEASKGLIKATQDLSTLIRDLQELWLFGGLDTLSFTGDKQASLEQEKALAVAAMVEQLARMKPSSDAYLEVQIARENGTNAADRDEPEAKLVMEVDVNGLV